LSGRLRRGFEFHPGWTSVNTGEFRERFSHYFSYNATSGFLYKLNNLIFNMLSGEVNRTLVCNPTVRLHSLAGFEPASEGPSCDGCSVKGTSSTYGMKILQGWGNAQPGQGIFGLLESSAR
jgi:hypothetical protein